MRIFDLNLYKMNKEPQSLAYKSLFKFVILGVSGIGKTLLIRRYVDGHFDHQFISTIGVDFKIKNVLLNNELYKL